VDKLPTLHRYPDGSAYYLKSKLSENLALPMEQIIIGNGSNELIELVVRTFLSQGQDVIQAFPTFLIYQKVVKGAGARIISAPLRNFKVDLREILKAWTPETKIVFINNPNNPTGSIVYQEEMRSFLEEIPNDVVVVLDEAYIEFVSDRDAARGLDLIGTHPLLLVLRTFSKLYGLAGLRIGYGFGPPKVIDFMNRVRQPFNVNTLAQAAATAALDDTDFVRKTILLVKQGLDFLYRSLDQMGLKYVPTHTNFFLIRVPQGGKEVYERMLRQGVIVRAMDSYGLPDYIRVNVGVAGENERFIKTLQKVIR
jgi:histidinol-phosphate aminotransferase